MVRSSRHLRWSGDGQVPVPADPYDGGEPVRAGGMEKSVLRQESKVLPGG